MCVSLPSLERIDLESGSVLANYLKATAAVCPFITPAAEISVLQACSVTLDCQTAHDIHPRLFEQMVPLIERFRDQRRQLSQTQQRLLVCHTVLVDMSEQLDNEAVRLLTWPNWLGWALKQLYTPKEIVFGFIRKRVVERTAWGVNVPAASFHAVVIRSRVVGSDGRFFTGNQPMLQAMMHAEDDDQDAHAAMLSEEMGTAIPDIRDPSAMRKSNYFDRIRKWGQSSLTKC